MKQKKGMLLMAVTLVLCVLLFMERLTGQVVHAVLGLVLVAIIAVHMTKLKGTWKYRKKAIRVLDVLLIVVMVLLVVSGILAHPLHDVLAVKMVHKLCAVLFVLGVLAHAYQHGKLRKPKS